MKEMFFGGSRSTEARLPGRMLHLAYPWPSAKFILTYWQRSVMKWDEKKQTKQLCRRKQTLMRIEDDRDWRRFNFSQTVHHPELVSTLAPLHSRTSRPIPIAPYPSFIWLPARHVRVCTHYQKEMRGRKMRKEGKGEREKELPRTCRID